MNDRDKLLTLLDRLETLEHRIVPPWQRAIVDVARQALENEITSIARKLRAAEAWRASARLRAV